MHALIYIRREKERIPKFIFNPGVRLHFPTNEINLYTRLCQHRKYGIMCLHFSFSWKLYLNISVSYFIVIFIIEKVNVSLPWHTQPAEVKREWKRKREKKMYVDGRMVNLYNVLRKIKTIKWKWKIKCINIMEIDPNLNE